MNEATHAIDIVVDGWYVHCPEPEEDQIYRVCKTTDKMWITLRKEFYTLEEAMEYAQELRHMEKNDGRPILEVSLDADGRTNSVWQ